MPPGRVGISLSARAFTATLATVAAVALFPTSALALKSPPTGAPCQIAPGEWTFCPYGGLARRNLSGADLGFANLFKANLTGYLLIETPPGRPSLDHGRARALRVECARSQRHLVAV